MAENIKKIGESYRVTMNYGMGLDGKRIRKYRSVHSIKEAKKILNEFNSNKDKNLLANPSKCTVADILVKWLDYSAKYKCEETTLHGYKNIINNHVIPFLGNIEIQKLQTHHIEEYIKHLIEVEKLSGNTVRKHITNIRSALKYAIKNQLIYRDVAAEATLPKIVKFKGTSYTKQELNTLIDRVADKPLELPIYIAANLGLRRGEITGLKWDKVDFENHVIHIDLTRGSAGAKKYLKPPKTKSSIRTLAIPDNLYTILLKHKSIQEGYKLALGDEYNKEGYVYVQDNGTPYRCNSLSEQFKEFLESNQLHVIRLHDLRHTFATLLRVEGKVDLFDISKALGHADMLVTARIYSQELDNTHKGTMDVMDSLIEKAS